MKIGKISLWWILLILIMIRLIISFLSASVLEYDNLIYNSLIE